MESFTSELQSQLDSIRDQGLYRILRTVDRVGGVEIDVGGRTYLNFSSNDYLGLASHPAVQEGAVRGIREFGSGSGASRLVSGSLAIHEQLEEALARFKGADACLIFSSGFAAAMGAVCSLVGAGDLIVTDRLIHASLVDAARLSKAHVQIFAHNDLEQLETILRDRDRSEISHLTGRRSRTLILTESIFSMDGDAAPLREIVELKEKYGAWLFVDEAHATGLYGPGRSGLVEELGLTGRVEIQMGTLSKAMGSSGGFICGARELREVLVNRARPFIFSTAPNPAASGAALAAVNLIASSEGRDLCARLWKNVRMLLEQLRRKPPQLPSAIVPVVIGDELETVRRADRLRENGIFIPGIRYPSVPRGTARLRVTLSAAHTEEQLSRLCHVLNQEKLAEPACRPDPAQND